MPRWIRFLIALAIGAALGLVYGWVIDPLEYVETTPDTLRLDYKADYALMVAEAFQQEGDPNLAARRLAVLGGGPPIDIVAQALEFALRTGYSESDIGLLQNLAAGLQAWSPPPEGGPP